MSVFHTDPQTKIKSESYAGAVLFEYEDNGYHDSYAYAIVWDDSAKIVRQVATWTTAGYTTTSATVDATPRSIERARAYAAKIIFEQMIKDHKVVAPGKGVRSLTTRGKAKGVSGTVDRFESDQYARTYGDYQPKVAVIKVTAPYDNPHYGRTLYVKPERLEVTDELTPEIENDYRQEAWLIAHERDLRSLFHPRWGLVYRPAELYR